ncbi:LysR family transcriptional regulator [Novispirillum itersonii]|uniref:DNA-binding transcriptional LysR family regulator n=1 Tax=Novispirillum itersonii TaxID=189 RepID=A0A7X0DL84_NOVIT|nr:LysR family transcriptional regulator [Novispirillum itersonii]MBB6209763.1 DNA-binding transcriptional LysR family regulator [Novispirillum itersonii]
MTDPLQAEEFPLDWDDLRLLLAIAEGRTLSAAARRLGINQTTVSRRLQAAELTLKRPLFHRLEGDLIPTESGAVLLHHARRVEEELLGAAHALRQGGAVTGTVRLTAVDSVLSCLVIPAVATLYQRYPGLTLELLGSQANANLNRREADIALRLAMPQDAGLTVRKVGDVAMAVYGPEGADAHRVPWLGYDDSLQDVPEARWLTGQLEENGERPVLRASSAALLLSAVQAGLGRAVLPCLLADRAPGVMRLSEVVVRRPLWLAVQSDVLRSLRVRVVADWLGEILKPLL